MNISHKIDPKLLLSLEEYKDTYLRDLLFNCIIRNILCASSNLYTRLRFIEEIINYPNLFLLFTNSNYFKKKNKSNIISVIIGHPLYNNSFNKQLINIFKKYIDMNNNLYNVIGNILEYSIYTFKEKSQNKKIEYVLNKTQENNNIYIIHLAQFSSLFYSFKNKDLQDEKSNNTLDNRFLLKSIFYAIDYGIINILEEKTARNDKLQIINNSIYIYETLKNEIENGFEADDYLLEKNILSSLYHKRKLLKERISFIETLNYSIFTLEINNFINICINLILKKNIECNDSILNSIIRFKYALKFDVSKDGDRLLISLIKKILDQNVLTNNNQLKIYSLFIISNRVTFSKDNCFMDDIYQNYWLWSKYFIENTIRLKNDEIFLMICVPNICYLFYKIYNKENMLLSYLYFTFHYNFKQFIHIVIKNYGLEFNELIKLCNTIDDVTNNSDNMYAIDCINKYNGIYFMGNFLNTLSFVIPDSVLCYENKYTYFETMNTIIENVGDTIFPSECFTIKQKIYKFDKIMNILCVTTKYILELFYVDLLKLYSIGFIDYNTTAWKNYMLIYSIYNMYTDSRINNFMLDTLENNIKDNKKLYDKLLGKFDDPITSTVIDEPMIVPPDIIMDKGVIYKHLMENNTNPFNREALDINSLNVFNKKIENVEKRDRFKKDMFELMYNFKKCN